MKVRDLIKNCYSEYWLLLDDQLISVATLKTYHYNPDKLFISLRFNWGDTLTLHYVNIKQLELVWSNITSTISSYEQSIRHD